MAGKIRGMQLPVIVSARGTARTKAKLTGVGSTVGRLNRGVVGLGRGIGSLGRATGFLSASAVASGVALGALVIPIKTATSEFIAYERELVNVRKTTNFTIEQMDVMGDTMLELSKSVPQTATELAGIAAIAGQLGFGEFGPESVASFTEIVAKFAAVTNLSTESAAKSFARIAKIMQLNISTTADFEDQFNRLSSTFNELGNTTTATAADIVNITQRIGGAAKTFGLTADQAAAIASTLVDVGESAERGSTALNQILTAAFRRTDEFAEVIGLAREEFLNLIRTDPEAAFKKLITELSKLDEVQTAEALAKIGIEGQRATNVALKLKDAMPTLTKNFNTADESWNGGLKTLEKMAETMNFSAQSADVVKKAIVGQASAFGFASKDISGLAVTLTQLGIDGADAAEIFGNVLPAIQTDMFGFASSIDMTRGEVQKLISENPAKGFAELLDAIDSKPIHEQELSFRRLGLTTSESIQSFRAFIAESSRLESNIDAAGEAFKFSNSTLEEFGILSQSTELQIKFLKDTMQTARIEVGENFAPVAIMLTRALMPLSTSVLPIMGKGMLDLIKASEGLAGSFGGIGSVVLDNIENNKSFSESAVDMGKAVNDFAAQDMDELANDIGGKIQQGVETALLLGLGTNAAIDILAFKLGKSIGEIVVEGIQDANANSSIRDSSLLPHETPKEDRGPNTPGIFTGSENFNKKVDHILGLDNNHDPFRDAGKSLGEGLTNIDPFRDAGGSILDAFHLGGGSDDSTTTAIVQGGSQAARDAHLLNNAMEDNTSAVEAGNAVAMTTAGQLLVSDRNARLRGLGMIDGVDNVNTAIAEGNVTLQEILTMQDLLFDEASRERRLAEKAAADAKKAADEAAKAAMADLEVRVDQQKETVDANAEVIDQTLGGVGAAGLTGVEMSFRDLALARFADQGVTPESVVGNQTTAALIDAAGSQSQRQAIFDFAKNQAIANKPPEEAPLAIPQTTTDIQAIPDGAIQATRVASPFTEPLAQPPQVVPNIDNKTIAGKLLDAGKAGAKNLKGLFGGVGATSLPSLTGGGPTGDARTPPEIPPVASPARVETNVPKFAVTSTGESGAMTKDEFERTKTTGRPMRVQIVQSGTNGSGGTINLDQLGLGIG